MQSAPPIEESERRDKDIGNITIDFLEGRIDGATYRAADSEYQADTRGQITFKDVSAFSDAIVWTLKKFSPGYTEEAYRERAASLVTHEVEHYDEATELGLQDVRFLLRFFRDNDASGLSFRPAITFDSPDSISDEELRRMLRSILEAPEELSDLDEAMIPKVNE